jgi:uncharacterized RDD family membrane protein YckC
MMKNDINREKPLFIKRVGAYLIDIIIVTLLATVISMIFIKNENYQKRSDELMKLTKDYTAGEITREEYSKEFDNLNYYVTKEGVGTTIINCSVAIVYYVVLCFFCHGITLGKYLMKLQIVSANEKELNMGNYLLRGLFANLILSNLVSIIFVYSMSKDTFVSVYPKVSSVLSLFILVTILVIMYRNDGRGLHDLLANTKVISTKEDKNNKDQEIKEAKVIEEKKVEKKTPKKTTTKKKTGGKK